MFGLIGHKPVVSDSFFAPITDRVVHLAKSTGCVIASVSCLAQTILVSAATVGTAFQFESLNEKSVSLWNGTQDNVFGIAAHLYGVLTPSGADAMLQAAPKAKKDKKSQKIKDPQNVFEHLHNVLQHPAVQAVSSIGSSHPLIKKVAVAAGGFFGWRMGIISARTAFIFTLLPAADLGWMTNLGAGYVATKFSLFPDLLYNLIDASLWGGHWGGTIASWPVQLYLAVINKLDTVAPSVASGIMVYTAWRVGRWILGEKNIFIKGLNFTTSLPSNLTKAVWRPTKKCLAKNQAPDAWGPWMVTKVEAAADKPVQAWNGVNKGIDTVVDILWAAAFGEEDKVTIVENDGPDGDGRVYRRTLCGADYTIKFDRKAMMHDTWLLVEQNTLSKALQRQLGVEVGDLVEPIVLPRPARRGGAAPAMGPMMNPMMNQAMNPAMLMQMMMMMQQMQPDVQQFDGQGGDGGPEVHVVDPQPGAAGDDDAAVR